MPIKIAKVLILVRSALRFSLPYLVERTSVNINKTAEVITNNSVIFSQNSF